VTWFTSYCDTLRNSARISPGGDRMSETLRFELANSRPRPVMHRTDGRFHDRGGI
jgi:hypothetical protein